MMRFFRGICSVALAAAAASCVAASDTPAAAPNVTYTAAGTFSIPPIAGNDLFQLQGESFSISIVANEALIPKSHGPQWAIYSPLRMTGTVQSRLLPTPTSISSNNTNIMLSASPSQDSFKLGAPVRVIGVTLTVSANIVMPHGTLTSLRVLPFTAPVTLTPAMATMTYSDGTNTTTLGINGTLTASIPGGAADVSLKLYGEGAQAIATHVDGSQSVRSISAGAVDLGATSDQVAVQFYASGVRDARDLHVQIGGEEVVVLYAGAAGSFSGLDQVSVQVPRSLAGRGDVELLLTVDGQTAGPVHLRMQ